MAALGLCQQPSFALGHPPPVAGHLGSLRIAIPKQNDELASGQGHPCVRAGGPPRKAPLRESLHHDPVALAVIEQEFKRGACAIAEDIDRALQRVLPKYLPTYGTKPIDAFAEVDWGRGHKDAALGRELQH